jgi:hypothetical protein
MARRAPRASAVADHRPEAAPLRAPINVPHLVHYAGEIVTSWRLWRARPRPDAVGLIVDAIVSFEASINPNGLTFEQWQAGCTVFFDGPRAHGVAVCGLGETFFEIVQQLGLTAIVGGQAIVQGTLREEQLREVEGAVDSLSLLVEILRAGTTAVSGGVSPADSHTAESVVQCDPYTSLQRFAETELRGQEREFLLMVIESMRQEPEIGLRFSTLSLRYRHPDFDCISYCKNKLQKLKVKIRSANLPYQLTQRENAAIIENVSL